jgi:site-specific DNA-methyltransferase (adenine-specific)
LEDELSRVEHLSETVTLYHGDCMDIIPTLSPMDHVICDPPYEKEAHRKDRRIMQKSGLVASPLSFDRIENRDIIASQCTRISKGWFLAFCQAEGVAPWRDSIENAGAKYKAPMIWVKPDGMPQFNGQGPGMGFESMVLAWCGDGVSKWNGGGRHGVFIVPKGNNNGLHETQKPVKLMREIVSLFTNPNEIICDPFMGSGTTGYAAIRLGRGFVGIEKDEKYFDVSVDRLSEALKQEDLFAERRKPEKQDSFL